MTFGALNKDIKSKKKKKKKNEKKKSDMVITFWDFFTLYQNICSPQVKRSVTIPKKNGIHELPHGLLSDSKLGCKEIRKLKKKI